MIYSLTIAPSMDYCMNMEDKTIRVGHTNRPRNDGVQLGGKGITVGRMLNNLKVKNFPILALGGVVGKSISRMVKNEYDHWLFLDTEGDSRIDVIIQGVGSDTRFNPPAPPLAKDELEKLYYFFDRNLTFGDVLILAGSTGSEVETFYADICKKYENVGAKIILDTTKKALTSALPYHPYMIKPNDDELAQTIGRQLNSEDEIIKAGLELKENGPKTLMITLGSRGAIYIAEDGSVYRASNAVGKQVSAVGAGDSSIAGFVKGIVENVSMEDRLRYAMAAGGATAFSKGLGTYDEWKKLLPEINVKKIA